MRLAAIDLGTNSFHLVIADTRPNGAFQVIESEKEMVRLGESAADMKQLTPEAMDRGIQSLRHFKSLLAARGVDHVKAVATSALREAENGDAFIRRARVEAGIEIEIISGYEEGRLIYCGASQALPIFTKRALVIDIGGGSTEYVLGERGKPKYITSLKLGAIRLTKKYNLADKPSTDDVLRCRKHIVGELALSARAILDLGYQVSVGSSGTAQALAAMIRLSRDGQQNGDRLNGFCFTYVELQQLLTQLLNAKSKEERSKLPGLDPKRVDIILAGALILQESMRLLKISEIEVSAYALREGVIFDQIQNYAVGKVKDLTKLHDVRERSVRHLAERANYEREHAEQVARIAISIFDQTHRLHGLGAEERNYLYFGALLHDIGYHIAHSEHHKHSQYLISHSELLGFTNEEINIIANVARYHRKSHPKLKHDGFAKLATDEHREVVQKLSSIIRLADGLDRGHLSLVRGVVCKIGRTKVKFMLDPVRQAPRNLELEVWGADRKKALFEETFSREVLFEDLSPKTQAQKAFKGLTAAVRKFEKAKRSAKKGVSKRTSK